MTNYNSKRSTAESRIVRSRPGTWADARADVPLLIVSLSGRALARSAHRAQIRARVVDLFCDLDTRSLSERCCRAHGEGNGFALSSINRALSELDPHECAGIVYGSGFEGLPRQLSELCRRRPLLGNDPDVVARLKHPEDFASLLYSIGVPHPQTQSLPPGEREGWLVKRAGYSGGGHVQWLNEDQAHEDGVYYQRFVKGRTLSATLLADGRRARVLGYSEQWCDTTDRQRPFVYGGAVSVQSLARALGKDLQAAVDALVEVTGLRGLCGLDFIIDGARWWLVEVNPRPSATFELHEDRSSLLRAHLDAVQGRLPRWTRERRTSRAHGVVYAVEDLAVPVDWRWPAWISDRAAPGTRFKRGEPVCTVHAHGVDHVSAKTELLSRRRDLFRQVDKWAA